LRFFLQKALCFPRTLYIAHSRSDATRERKRYGVPETR
jgi:hypothetical protein